MMMRTVLFLLLCAPVFGQSWEEANELYRKGNYAQAVESYQTLLRDNPANPYLHFNLANAYFKEGSNGGLGHAVIEYWRAFSLDPRDTDIRFNFDFALKRAGESLVPSGVPESFHYLFYLLSEAELLGVAWLGWWVALLVASAAFLVESRYRTALRPWIIGAAATWAVFGSWWGLRRMADIPNPGVVVETGVEARSGPGSNFSVTFNPPQGRRISILSRQGDWAEIDMIKEGLRGWVPTQSVERVESL